MAQVFHRTGTMIVKMPDLKLKVDAGSLMEKVVPQLVVEVDHRGYAGANVPGTYLKLRQKQTPLFLSVPF